MGRAASLMRGSSFCLLVIVGLLLGPVAIEAKAQPSDMPRNLLSPMFPYKEGIASVEAQDAARPKAVKPKLPDHSSPITKIGMPAGVSELPRPETDRAAARP